MESIKSTAFILETFEAVSIAANHLIASVSREPDDDPGRPLVHLTVDLEIVRCGCRGLGDW